MQAMPRPFRVTIVARDHDEVTCTAKHAGDTQIARVMAKEQEVESDFLAEIILDFIDTKIPRKREKCREDGLQGAQLY